MNEEFLFGKPDHCGTGTAVLQLPMAASAATSSASDAAQASGHSIICARRYITTDPTKTGQT